MRNIIQSELFKLQKLRAFRILLVIMVANALLTVLVASSTRDFWNSLGMADTLSGINLYYAALGDTVVMVIAGTVLAGIFLCSDFENRTMQTAISSGCSRFSVIIGKTAVYFLALAILLIPVVLITGAALFLVPAFGMVFTPAVLVHMIAVSGVMLLVYAASLSICIPFSFVVKKSSATIALGLIVLLFGVSLAAGIGYFVPWVSSVLSWLPFTLPDTILTYAVSPADLLKAAGISIGFILLMIAATCALFRRTDLK